MNFSLVRAFRARERERGNMFSTAPYKIKKIIKREEERERMTAARPLTKISKKYKKI